MLYLSYFSFFFQAEDGIRDIGVTGVQTCALPISEMASSRRNKGRNRRVSHGGASWRCKSSERISVEQTGALRSKGFAKRSEERRVGKECRYRWSQCH